MELFDDLKLNSERSQTYVSSTAVFERKDLVFIQEVYLTFYSSAKIYGMRAKL